MTDTPTLPAFDWPVLQPGWVWLCGAGPGDPGLLTLHAANALRQADVVIYDALVQEAILDWAPQAEHIYAGKRGGKPSAKQRDISLQLVDLARAGKKVLRLKGGDPSIFGRATEEMEALGRHGIAVSICPGITAASAASASLGISLTLRGMARKLVFVTAHVRAGEELHHDWKSLADPESTLAIYMGKKAAPVISAGLIQAGLPAETPVALIENASLANERVFACTLALLPLSAATALGDGPALILVGEAVRPTLTHSQNAERSTINDQQRFGVTPDTGYICVRSRLSRMLKAATSLNRLSGTN